MKKLVTPKELADRWGMSVDTLKKWRCIKKGPPFIKIGGKNKSGRDTVRYEEDEIAKYERKNGVNV